MVAEVLLSALGSTLPPSVEDYAFYSEIMANTEIAGAAISMYTDKIVDAINPMVRTLMTIFVILWGFALMRGMIDKPIQDIPTCESSPWQS